MNQKINVAMPAYGSSFRGAFTRSLFQTLVKGANTGLSFSFSEVDYSDIAVSRNYLLSNFFYKTDCSHILMVDCDMGFPPDLVPAMLALDKPVVGAIYPRRGLDLRRLHSLSNMPFEKAMAMAVDFIGTPSKPRQVLGGFMRMQACGAGVLLISRACVQRMVETIPDIVDTARFRSYPFAPLLDRYLTAFDRIEMPDAALSEDVAFCRRWVVECNGEIWASFDRRIDHVVQLTLSAALSDRIKD